MAKVSIITISYNNFAGLKKTMESVFSQDYQNYEYIVIDGGSSDGSKDLIERFSAKINYWVSEPDRGVYHAMNKAIKVAKGEYLHFLNSGDIYANKTVLSSIFFTSYDVPLIRTIQICDYGSHQVRWTNLGDRVVTLYDMYVNTMLHQATFMRCDLFEKYGLYDESLKIVSDWKFFFQLVLGGEKTVFVNVESVIFEMNGISTNKFHGEEHIRERIQVLDKLMPDNLKGDYQRLKLLESDSYISTTIKSNSFYLVIFKMMNKFKKILTKSGLK